MIKEVIINADDFGLKSSVNKAIVESFNKGLINNTTIMVNMPGFEEAVDLAHKNKFIDKIGIHLVLSAGSPLTKDSKSSGIFYYGDESGLKKFKVSLFFLSGEKRRIIYKEFAAQIEKANKAGLRITHIDTHHHMDDIWSITRIILELLREFNIPSMRILNNLNRATPIYKISYRKIINAYIKFRKANFSDFFGNRDEGLSLLMNGSKLYYNKKLEIMVHPDYNNSGLLINRVQEKEIIFDLSEDPLKTLQNSAL